MSRRDLLYGAGAAIAVTGLAGCGSRGTGAASPSPASTTSPSSATTSATSATTIAAPGPRPQRPVPAGPATAVTNGPRDRPMVALTFHLGPHLADEDVALAHQLLDDAGRLGAPITVFAVGRWLDQHRDLVPSILAGGNELDNHTYTHPVLTDLTAGAVASEITLCRDVLTRLAPSEGRYFRPSGTSQATPLILEQAGVAGYSTVVDFDVDPLDYTDPGADAVVQRVQAGAQPGSIVSMHFGHPGTVAAFPHIIGDLRGRGLEPALVRTLLA